MQNPAVGHCSTGHTHHVYGASRSLSYSDDQEMQGERNKLNLPAEPPALDLASSYRGQHDQGWRAGDMHLKK